MLLSAFFLFLFFMWVSFSSCWISTESKYKFANHLFLSESEKIWLVWNRNVLETLKDNKNLSLKRKTNSSKTHDISKLAATTQSKLTIHYLISTYQRMFFLLQDLDAHPQLMELHKNSVRFLLGAMELSLFLMIFPGTKVIISINFPSGLATSPGERFWCRVRGRLQVAYHFKVVHSVVLINNLNQLLDQMKKEVNDL